MEIKLTNQNGKVMVSSRVVAEDFGKRHTEVLRKIDGLIADLDSTQNYVQLFIEHSYKDASGKANKEYLLTRDGFSLLVMGFTGKEALQWKLKYIDAFNKMEEKIRNQQQLTPIQQCALTILDDNTDSVERISALETFKKLSVEEGLQVGYSQGLKRLCKGGVVTIPQIMEYIQELYPDKFNYANDVQTCEWSRYLKHMGYLHMVHFRRKHRFGMEDKPVYQPTQLFYDVLVEQGMAIVRSIDDERGKVEVTYTVELEKFLTTNEFVETFFTFLDSKYEATVMDEMCA